MSTLDREDERSVVLVVDIGGTSAKMGFTIDGRPYDYKRLFSSADLRKHDPIASLASMIEVVILETSLKPDLVVSTVPGFLDIDEDRVVFASNIPELNGRRLASELSEHIGIPVILERDSVLALIGESLAGSGRGVSRTLGIFFGTGVGAAYIESGKPFRGTGWALEIGHMPFNGEGRQLVDMRRECLEAYVSGRALQMIAARHATPIEDIFVAAAEIPQLALELETFVRNQAFAIGTAITLFSPEATIIGGGVCAMQDFPKDRLLSLVESFSTFAESPYHLDLRWAQLGWRSALYGATQAAQVHFRRLPHPVMKGSATGTRSTTQLPNHE